VPRDPRACVVVSALLNLLDALDVQVVVNGVDSPAQLQWLSSWPKALMQGFQFPRPKPGLASALAPGREL
jgi:EAL domain-containing protein (putative c-di-GMP-specific phosphodiesterase class I)